MLLSMRWLSDYVKVESSLEEYIDDMTMSGNKVESVKVETDHIKNVVVGQIREITKHKNADSLLICQMDVGKEKLIQIVTGADNISVGDLVPVALHKSKLPNGLTIKRGKLRGEKSEGMLCSLEELNLTVGDFPYGDEDGIFIIEEDCEVGDLVSEALGINDTIIEFEITSNRPDCLAVLGLAKESAATYGSKFTPNLPQVKGGEKSIQEFLNLEVKNAELCPRYMAAVVYDVEIGPSPRWMRERLRASGVRPINNIVDITNYVMLEYGYPMHAFDHRHVEGGQIIVRNANEGEEITTLEGAHRVLSSDMLVIADAKNPSAIAGVMGGEYSGIYDDTTTVVFESANFDGPSVRRTSRALNMRTESSGRFEKGLDSRICDPALRRACELVELLGIGTVANGFLDADNQPYTPKEILFDPDWINEFVGVDIPREEMELILNNLHFEVEGDKALVPSFRANDMTVPSDIAEEVARMYGYNKIPTTVLRGVSQATVPYEQQFRRRISSTLTAQGYSEIITYSFYSPKNFDRLQLPEDDPRRHAVTLRNPLGEETSTMRTTAIPSMLMTLAHNYNNRNPEAWLFELASTYLPIKGEELPAEPRALMLGQYGENADFFTLKGGVEALLENFVIADASFEAVTDDPIFHSGRCARLVIGGEEAGIFGQIHPYVADNYEIGRETYVAQLDYQILLDKSQKDHLYTPLPRFPALTRDLALVCDADLPVGDLESAIRKGIGSILEDVELFDVYQGDQIEKGKKSVAYALTLRGSDRTLTDKEADDAMAKALGELEKIGAQIRA